MPANGWGGGVGGLQAEMERNWTLFIRTCTNTVENRLGVHFQASNLQVQFSFQEAVMVQFTLHPPGVSHYLYSFPRFFCGYRWGATCGRASGSSLKLRGNDIAATGSSVSSELHSNHRWHIRKTRWSEIGELRRSPTALESRGNTERRRRRRRGVSYD